jgi:hypothetical protein
VGGPGLSGHWAPGRSDRQRIAIDATPSYVFWPHAMERMRAYRPDMRLIASLRDPIERAFSHWARYLGVRKSPHLRDVRVRKSPSPAQMRW